MKPLSVFLLILVIAILIYAFVFLNKANSYVESVQTTRSPREIVQELINKSSLSLDKIKEEAAKQNVIVLEEKETHTMEYNPRRVILKTNTICGIVPPCFSTYQILSVG